MLLFLSTELRENYEKCGITFELAIAELALVIMTTDWEIFKKYLNLKREKKKRKKKKS